MRAGVAVGSNLGDRLANLRASRREIVNLAGIVPPILSSAIYETDPFGCELGAGKFLNAVIEFGYEGDVNDLFGKLREIEVALGRPREHARNISRNIDIDLLYFGSVKSDNERLELPHPRMYLRRFVLRPLADIRPDLVLPRQAKTVCELLALLDESVKVVRLTSDWESR